MDKKKDRMSKLVGEVDVVAKLEPDDHDHLADIEKRYWMITNVKVLEDNQIQISVAYGKTIIQGKVIAPADMEFSSTILIEKEEKIVSEDKVVKGKKVN